MLGFYAVLGCRKSAKSFNHEHAASVKRCWVLPYACTYLPGKSLTASRSWTSPRPTEPLVISMRCVCSCFERIGFSISRQFANSLVDLGHTSFREGLDAGYNQRKLPAGLEDRLNV
jgi:hypothetical protein